MALHAAWDRHSDPRLRVPHRARHSSVSGVLAVRPRTGITDLIVAAVQHYAARDQADKTAELGRSVTALVKAWTKKK